MGGGDGQKYAAAAQQRAVEHGVFCCQLSRSRGIAVLAEMHCCARAPLTVREGVFAGAGCWAGCMHEDARLSACRRRPRSRQLQRTKQCCTAMTQFATGTLTTLLLQLLKPELRVWACGLRSWRDALSRLAPWCTATPCARGREAGTELNSGWGSLKATFGTLRRALSIVSVLTLLSCGCFFNLQRLERGLCRGGGDKSIDRDGQCIA